MCGYIWVFHCWEGSSREPIRENDPLDRQSLYTGTKFMTVSKAKECQRVLRQILSISMGWLQIFPIVESDGNFSLISGRLIQ